MNRKDVAGLRRGDKLAFRAPFKSFVRGVVKSNSPMPGDLLPVVVEWEDGSVGRVGLPDVHRLTKICGLIEA